MNVIQYLVIVANGDTGEQREVVVMHDPETTASQTQAITWVAGMLAEPWTVRMAAPVVEAVTVTA